MNWSISGYDKEDPNIKSGLSVVRDALILTGEYAGDYGENHLWYKVTGISPGTVNASAVDSGQERESSYTNGQTTYKYYPYRKVLETSLSNPSYSDCLIDLYFKNGDISSVEINLYGKYTYHDFYHSDDSDIRDQESSSDYTYSQRISLLR